MGVFVAIIKVLVLSGLGAFAIVSIIKTIKSIKKQIEEKKAQNKEKENE